MGKVDFAILGSGISGTYAAILLANKGFSVTLLSLKLKETHYLPETWIYSPIEGVDLEESFIQSTNVVFSSSDGKRKVSVSISNQDASVGSVVQVDKNKFGQILLRKAQELGVQCIEIEKLNDVEFLDEYVKISFSKDRQLFANMVFDATGKSSWLANHLNLPFFETELDSRNACFSHFEGNGISQDVQIISIVGGYLFHLPINGSRFSLGCVVTKKIAFKGFEHLKQSAEAQNLIGNAKQVLPVIPIRNFQRQCLRPAGKRYRLIGDAAVFMDPFFCPGIDFAIATATQAIDLEDADYQQFIVEWIKCKNVIKKIGESHWNEVIKLFADPHLPHVIPIVLTQGFSQLKGELEEAIMEARAVYV